MELAVSKAVAPPSIGKPSRKTAKVIPHTASKNAVRSALERTTCFTIDMQVVSKLKVRDH